MAGFTVGADRVDCRAWMNCSGTTQAINDDYNFDSLTETATGQYYANFSVAMPNSNYIVLAGTVVPNYPGRTRMNPDSTSRARVWTSIAGTGGNYADCSVLQIAIFGA